MRDLLQQFGLQPVVAPSFFSEWRAERPLGLDIETQELGRVQQRISSSLKACRF